MRVMKGARFAMLLALLLSSGMLSSAGRNRMLLSDSSKSSRELESYGSQTDDGLRCNGCPINHCAEDCRLDPTDPEACPQNEGRWKNRQKGPGIGSLIPNIGIGIGDGYGVSIPGLGNIGSGFGVGVGVGVGEGSGSGGSAGFGQGLASGGISVPSEPMAGDTIGIAGAEP